MKGINIIFQMIPLKSVWVKWFGHLSPTKLSIFPKKTQNAEKCTLFTSAKNLFLAHFFSKSCHLKTDKDFSMKPTANGHKCPKFSVRKSRASLSQPIIEIFKLEEWPQLIRKF